MTDDLIDYKLMCFNGKVKCSFVCTNRHSKEGIRVTFYNLSWEMMPFERHYPKDEQAIEKPQSYDQMIQLAEQLAVGLPFVRVDFYEVGEVPFLERLLFIQEMDLKSLLRKNMISYWAHGYSCLRYLTNI